MSGFKRKGVHDSRLLDFGMLSKRLDDMSFRITDVRRYPLFFHEGYTSGAD